MNYFLGLDIGTESVGWAVTDETYQIVKKRGKALWGVRLFNEAQTAAERRQHRTQRRRYERQKQRIAWLQELFAPEIGRVDPAFFVRMEESKFLEQERRTDDRGRPLGKYTLFADKHYSDTDYHREFPTIYHLRNALMFEERAFDVRLVYLAIHHIMKKLGHFLFEDIGLENVTFASCWEEICECLEDQFEKSFVLQDEKAFVEVLKNRKLRITDKKKLLRLAAGLGKEDTQWNVLVDLLAGAKVKPSVLFEKDRIPKENDGTISLEGDLDENLAKLSESVEDLTLLYALKKLYDWALLEDLRAGKDYISQAKIAVYEEHHAQLQRLKEVFRADRKAYREMFVTSAEKLDNYAAYSDHGTFDRQERGHIRRRGHHCSYEQFSAYGKKKLRELLPKLKPRRKKQAEAILEEWDRGTFLVTPKSKDNSVIPYQLHEQELKRILDRASRYLPFLLDRDESGLTRAEQIMEVFRFRVPFYVGPLHTRSANAWVERSMEPVHPWNFDRVVNKTVTRERFIDRMTSVCSYLGEKILPRDSLLYSRYAALNLINKLTLNGHPISVETKQRIMNELILVREKTGKKQLTDFLKSRGMMQPGDEIGGLDEEFRITMTGYYVFARILSRGDAQDMVEDIIKHCVLFGQDRKLLQQWLADSYGDRLSDEDQAYILRKHTAFKGWGSLSGELLTQIFHKDEVSGDKISIIDALWNTNHNLMELLSSEFGFADAVEAYRAEKLSSKPRTLEEILKDAYASPGIKRSIHQAMAILSEVEKIMGSEPRRVFVEVTRGEGEKKRTVSRKAQLTALYQKCAEESPELFKDLEDLQKSLENTPEGDLRRDKLYLYYLQQGRCMYSGETISLLELETFYDIDHIYPQSKVKDDSLDNRVLVKKTLNGQKGDKYPIPLEVIGKNARDLWKTMRRMNWISEAKYRRLTRREVFTEAEASGFIARQLVETSQACKIVAELLKRRYRGSDRVVYVKAGNVASFRQDQRVLEDGTQIQAYRVKGKLRSTQDPVFVKCREVNPFHHAKDAYLNIVVGNVYHVKFTRNPLLFIRGGQEYSLNRMFDWDVVRNGEWAWHKGEDGSIATVRRMMAKNNIFMTRYAYTESGGLFDLTLVRNGQASIKKNDPRMTTERFGGYNKRAGAYFMLVEHREKKKTVRSLEPVFIMEKALYERDAVEYCEKILGLQEPRILIGKIKTDALLSLDGFRMHISGRTGEQYTFKNAAPLLLSPVQNRYIKWIAKYVERCNAAGRELDVTTFDGISAEENIALYQALREKLESRIYQVRLSAPAKKLREHAEEFAAFSVRNQGKLILEILHLFQNDMVLANFSAWDESASTGRIVMSKNISGMKDHRLTLIHQSVTGFYEQEIDLLGDSW